MAYDFKDLQSGVEDTVLWLQKEYHSIRSGQITTSILDGVRVDSYGAKLPVMQVANVTIEDARTLRIIPYDVSQIKEIEKAIVDTNLGLSVSSDEKGLRVISPQMTSENRKTLVKVANDKLEQSRVALRSERDKTWQDIQEKEKSGELSEDEKFRYKEEMQKIVDEGSRKLESMAEKKETEIMG